VKDINTAMKTDRFQTYEIDNLGHPVIKGLTFMTVDTVKEPIKDDFVLFRDVTVGYFDPEKHSPRQIHGIIVSGVKVIDLHLYDPKAATIGRELRNKRLLRASYFCFGAITRSSRPCQRRVL